MKLLRSDLIDFCNEKSLKSKSTYSVIPYSAVPYSAFCSVPLYPKVTKAYDVTSVNSIIVTPAACDVSSVNNVIGYSLVPTVCDVVSVNSDTAVSAVADATSGEGPSDSVITDHSIIRKGFEQVTIDAVETQRTSKLGAGQNPQEELGVEESDESLLDA